MSAPVINAEATTALAPKPRCPRPLLLNGIYMLFWTGQTISSMGT